MARQKICDCCKTRIPAWRLASWLGAFPMLGCHRIYGTLRVSPLSALGLYLQKQTVNDCIMLRHILSISTFEGTVVRLSRMRRSRLDRQLLHFGPYWAEWTQ